MGLHTACQREAQCRGTRPRPLTGSLWAQSSCLLAQGLPQFLASRYNSSPHGPWLVATSRQVCPRWEPQRPCHLLRAVAHPCYQVLLSRFGSSWEGAEVWTLRGSPWGCLRAACPTRSGNTHRPVPPNGAVACNPVRAGWCTEATPSLVYAETQRHLNCVSANR